MSNDHSNDPLGFVKNMWGNMGFSLPGMVAPTFDVNELEKRIKDLKAVEGWLRMNLTMLQTTIQGLEMQVSTLSAVQSMGAMASSAAQQMAQNAAQNNRPAAATPPAPEPAAAAAETDAAGTLSQTAMWPWQLMQQMQEQLQQQAEAAKGKSEDAADAADAASKPKRSRKTTP